MTSQRAPTRPQANLELKAADPDPNATLAKALALGAHDHGVLMQHDTFYKVPSGRLKLRRQTGDGGGVTQLIHYFREDVARVKLSRYRLLPTNDPDGLDAVLRQVLGVTDVVRKTRRLLIYREVRIHLDDVAELGTFVELESVGGPGPILETQRAIVDLVVGALAITPDRIEAGAYADLARPRTGNDG